MARGYSFTVQNHYTVSVRYGLLDRTIKELERRRKYGLVWEDKSEKVIKLCSGLFICIIEPRRRLGITVIFAVFLLLWHQFRSRNPRISKKKSRKTQRSGI